MRCNQGMVCRCGCEILTGQVCYVVTDGKGAPLYPDKARYGYLPVRVKAYKCVLCGAMGHSKRSIVNVPRRLQYLLRERFEDGEDMSTYSIALKLSYVILAREFCTHFAQHMALIDESGGERLGVKALVQASAHDHGYVADIMKICYDRRDANSQLMKVVHEKFVSG